MINNLIFAVQQPCEIDTTIIIFISQMKKLHLSQIKGQSQEEICYLPPEPCS